MEATRQKLLSLLFQAIKSNSKYCSNLELHDEKYFMSCRLVVVWEERVTLAKLKKKVISEDGRAILKIEEEEWKVIFSLLFVLSGQIIRQLSYCTFNPSQFYSFPYIKCQQCALYCTKCTGQSRKSRITTVKIVKLILLKTYFNNGVLSTNFLTKKCLSSWAGAFG